MITKEKFEEFGEKKKKKKRILKKKHMKS